MAFLRRRKNAECINRGLRSPRALPWAECSNWAYSPPQSFTGRLCKLVRFYVTFVPGRHLTHNFSPCTNVHINGQSSSLLEYSATARKRGYFKHTSGCTILVRPDARDSFHYPQANFSFLPDSFHYLRRKSLLQSL